MSTQKSRFDLFSDSRSNLRKRIYLDYASLTPVAPEVLKVIKKYSSGEFANPASLYEEGVNAKKVLAEARKKTADFFHAHPDEIIFTGSGTEANNLAVRGLIEQITNNKSQIKNKKKFHIITSIIEHSSILEPIKVLEKEGIDVTYVGVDSSGVVDIKELKKALRPETVLVSIQYVNNEIGTIQPISEIAKLLRHSSKSIRYTLCTKPFFHTDASQATCYLPLYAEVLGADLVTIDAHKCYGHRGIGLLYKKRNVPLLSLLFGGGQEYGFRPATENIPAIAGFAEALALIETRRARDVREITLLRDYFINKLLKINPRIELNGDREKRLPNNVNISIKNIDNELFVLQLDAKGIAASTKSSCLRDEEESYVIRALGKGQGAKTAVRFSMGRETTKAELEYTLQEIKHLLR